MSVFSSMLVPVILCFVGMIMIVSKRDMLKEFIEGAKDGMESCIDLLPTLLLLICAVKMFNASGAASVIASFMDPLLSRIGIPSELTPLLVVRPVSGGASNAIIESVFSEYGADSFIGRCASVIAGSSDTVIYIIALYFSSVNIRKSSYALPVSFLVMFFCIVFSCFICRVYFSS